LTGRFVNRTGSLTCSGFRPRPKPAGGLRHLHHLEFLHRLLQELRETHDTGRSHRDARVDRHYAAARLADDARREVEVDLFVAGIDEHVIRVTGGKIVILHLMVTFC
jgi:hypothetical protein